MKVVLLQDIRNVGRKYEVVDVKDGYGLNFLIPQKKAKTATAGVLKEVEQMRAKIEAERKMKEEELAQALGKIDGTEVNLSAKANEQGHLFAGIGREEILEALKTQHSIELDPSFLVLGEPFKEVGETELQVKALESIATIKVVIKGEE